MRQKIAAGNWKMNLSYEQGSDLVDKLKQNVPSNGAKVIIGVPYPYLKSFNDAVSGIDGIDIAAQNCHHEVKGAYTGEVAISMLDSIGLKYVIVGHSERRQYFNESDEIIKTKVDLCLSHNITPIYCCGEPLEVREAGDQVSYVKSQISNSLLHLSTEEISKLIIAYEPIWAIGTGVTASPDQAQEMHHEIRKMLSDKYGNSVANDISILYGGSVKPNNAQEIFAKGDVDGGLVGGASLDAPGFIEITLAF
jgi:triosephosphate isomerase